jgi:transposase-like protein
MKGKEFAEWMDKSGLSLSETAHLFGVSEQTVYKWRSTRGVPAAREAWVKARMQDTITHHSSGLRSLVLDVDRDTFRRWNRAALNERKLIEDWAHDALEEASSELYDPGNETTLRVAEPA